MATRLTRSTGDRLNEQIRHERALAAGVLAAEARLAGAVEKMTAVIAEQRGAVAECRDEVADAVIAYVDQAGVGIDRVAVILDRPRDELARLVRARRAAVRQSAPSRETA